MKVALRKFKVVTNPLRGKHEVIEAEKYEAKDGFFHFVVLDSETGNEVVVASFSQALTPQIMMINE